MSPSLGSADVGKTIRISAAPSGTPANWHSRQCSVSANGNRIAFVSEASNLVPNDTNRAADVFVRDLAEGWVKRVSLTAEGEQSAYLTQGCAISADGRFVAFNSYGNDFVPNDTGFDVDVFVHDIVTGLTRIVSKSSAGQHGNGNSVGTAISEDGRFIAFLSEATNLVDGDTNNQNDVFLHDSLIGETVRVSVSSTGVQGDFHCFSPSISSDGRFTCFESRSPNLVNGDNNRYTDIFVHDRLDRTTRRVSISSAGFQADNDCGDPVISGNGRFVAFASHAKTLVSPPSSGRGHIFVHDQVMGVTSLISATETGTEADGNSERPSLTYDGRLVAYSSHASNLVEGLAQNLEEDVFVLDRLTSKTTAASLNRFGTAGNDDSDSAFISGDGHFVAFVSNASNLVAGEFDRWFDVFLFEYGPVRQIATFALGTAFIAGNNRTTATVSLANPAPPNGIRIALSASSTSVLVPSGVTVVQGATARTFGILVTPVTAAVAATLTARFGTQTLSANLTLVPLIPSAMRFTPSPATGGKTVSCRLVLNGVAPAGGKVVTVSDNSAFCATPGLVTIPAGASQAVFEITTSAVGTTQYVTVTASVAEGTRTGLLVLRP